MSELQNGDSVVETNNPVIEDRSDGADLATASDDQHESTDQVDEEAKKQKATQDIINTKTFEAKQAQRDLQSATDKLKAFEDAEMQRKEALVVNIPPPPDQYDDDFDKKMADRDAAILAKADFNSTKRASQQQQEQLRQQAAQQQDQKIQASIVSYDARATELGIVPAELQAAGSAVMQYGLSEDLAIHILDDPDGPLITKHLAANPQEGFELASMSPYAVGAYLDKIKVKAAGLKPKQSGAPSPADSLSGNGVDPNMGKYRNIDGAQFT
jgi:hypothetical protein